MNRNELIQAIQRKVADEPNISEEKLDDTVEEALARYSQERPRTIAVDVPGTGAFEYNLPTGFVDDFSSMLSVQYPFDPTDQNPPYVKAGDDFQLYRGTVGLVLRFAESRPASGELFRATYTAPHTVTVSSTTVPQGDERAVINLGAALLCEMLAAEYERRSRSTLPEATFDLRTKSQEYQTQADRYYKLWRDQMGISDDGRPQAAVAWTDTDWTLSDLAPPLTHPIQ